MKKVLMLTCLVILAITVVISTLGISPFSNIDIMVEKDYVQYKIILERFIEENDERNMYMNKDLYDSSSVNACKIFEDLQYQFVRASHGNVFFCKGYNGMSGIGLLYSKTSFIPNSKQKVLKILDENWLIISEHNL